MKGSLYYNRMVKVKDRNHPPIIYQLKPAKVMVVMFLKSKTTTPDRGTGSHLPKAQHSNRYHPKGSPCTGSSSYLRVFRHFYRQFGRPPHFVLSCRSKNGTSWSPGHPTPRFESPPRAFLGYDADKHNYASPTA